MFFGKDVSERNVTWSDDGLSVVGRAQRGMSYAEDVSEQLMNNKIMIANDLILLK